MTLRRELVEIQKRLVTRIKRQIYSAVRTQKNIQKYYEEYKSVTENYEEISNKEELVDKASQADIVYVGDYHTLRQSQKVFSKLLEDILKASSFKKTGIVICLEMFLNKHTEFVNAFIEGKMNEQDFLQKIDYNKNWGFAWKHYSPILEVAMKNHFKVIGLNSHPTKRGTSLVRRDKFAAKIISNACLKNPDCLIAVLFGDLHIAETHLPLQTDLLLSNAQKQFKKFIVYQNIERFYWKLAEQELEHIVDVLRINDYAYAVMSTPPLVKFQSYFNWQENCEELQFKYHPDWGSMNDNQIDFSSQVIELVQIISKFLEIPAPEMDDLTVYSMDDLDFLKKIKKDSSLSADEIADIETSILKGESSFIPGKNAIYLSNLSINHAAEESAHYIYFNCSRADHTAKMTKKDKFYFLVLKNALGYFGSKIINHKRLCYKEKDFEIFIAQNIDRKLRDPKLREVRSISVCVVRHKEYERRFLKTGEWEENKKLYPSNLSLIIGVTHAIGYVLGEKLYSAMIQDYINKENLRHLFCTDFTLPGCAFETYLDLIKKMQFVKDLYESKTEKM